MAGRSGGPWAHPRLVPAGEELIGVGGSLNPETLVLAYASGVFPMPMSRRRIGWWSPDPRGVLPLPHGMRVTSSLRASARTMSTTVDTAFAEVLDGCADPNRDGGWINGAVREAYLELHRLGLAHSVETRSSAGDLIGGLYGVEINGLFAGESMFHRARDASKVALLALVERLSAAPGRENPGVGRLLDTQWATDHLKSLGVVEVTRSDYLDALDVALTLPAAFDSPEIRFVRPE